MDQGKIGNFIASIRKEKNLTQQELADKIGVTDRAVSKWETGRGLPDYDHIQNLCSELGITFSEFIAGEKIAPSDSNIKLEESLISTYKDSRKTKKELSTIKTILLTIVSITVIFVGMFAIDVHRMRSNKPVMFSTWGFKYCPPVDIDDLKLEQAIKNYFYTEQQKQIKAKNLVNGKGFVEVNTFLIEETKDKTEYTVSCLVLEEVYCEIDGEVVCDSGSSIPYKFIVSRNDSGYEVKSYQMPEDGNLYESSLKQIFSSSVLRQIEDFYYYNGISRLIFEIEQERISYYGK